MGQEKSVLKHPQIFLHVSPLFHLYSRIVAEGESTCGQSDYLEWVKLDETNIREKWGSVRTKPPPPPTPDWGGQGRGGGVTGRRDIRCDPLLFVKGWQQVS